MKIYWSPYIDDYVFDYGEFDRAYYSYDRHTDSTVWLAPFFDSLKLEFICGVK